MAKLPKIFIALAIQLLVLLFMAISVYLASIVVEPPYPYLLLVILQGFFSALLVTPFGLPKWWRLIQFLLPLGLYGAILVQFNPIWALVIFIAVWLVFSNVFGDRVPLYLTNSATRQALLKFIKPRQFIHFLDLGSGLGSNVVFMAQQKGVQSSHGVETAPLPYLWSKIYCLLRGGEIFAMDIWKTQLSYYDVVYAFLSPEPMAKLWLKVQDEMRPGTVFISNSFAVPGIEPSEVWQLNDARQTKLYIYNIE